MTSRAEENLSGIGQGGTGMLKVDGKVARTRKMEHTIPIILQFEYSRRSSPPSLPDLKAPWRICSRRRCHRGCTHICRPEDGTAAAVERARKAVTNRIWQTLARITSVHQVLGLHLRNAVHTATRCAYTQERPTRWWE
jgi:hypothetical protein